MSAPVGSQVAGSQTSAGTKIAAWVFDKFVGGAFSSAAGFGMDQVLSLIGLKETSMELARRLTNIQAGIDQILREVTAIRLQLEALFEALGIAKADILRAIDESAIADSRSVIETHYGTGSSMLTGGTDERPTSLALAVSRRSKGNAVDTKWFADNVLGTWDIQRHVVRIAQIAGQKSPLKETPLLRAFTDYLITANRGNNASRALSTYLSLEAYFQELLEIQFKGLGLVAAAMCCDVRDEAKARSITKDFLADVAPYFTKEADLFVQCADEIVMAIFTDKATRFLYSPWPTKPADVIVKIARRANVLRTLVYAAVGAGPATVGGIHGTVYGRFVDSEADRERTLSMPPWGDSKGTEIGPLAEGNAPIEWEVSSDRRSARLREKSKSGFRAFHYFLPWSTWAPPMDRPLTSDFGGIVARWYDLDTLEEVDKGGENRVIIADFCDMRFLQGAVLRDDGLVSIPAGLETTNNNQYRKGHRKGEQHGIHAITADETPYRLLAKGTLEAHMAYNPPQVGPVGYDLIFALFRYNGPEAKLLFTWDMKMSLKLLENVWPTRGGRNATMRMSPRGKIDLLRKRDGQPDEAATLYGTDWQHSLWAKTAGAHSEDNRVFTAEAALANTGGKEDSYSLALHFDVVNDLGEGLTSASDIAKGSIEYEIQAFRIAWK